MTSFQKIKNIVIAILLLAAALFLAFDTQHGYLIVLLILAISLVVLGLKSIIYYIMMARFMVDGKIILYRGIIILDIGIFTMTLTDFTTVYITLYFIVLYLFNALINILRALEAKKMGAQWKYKFGYGIFCILICVACGIFLATPLSERFALYVYCFGLFYSAVLRLISSFKRSSVLFIEN